MEQHRKVLLACLVAGAALIVTGILSGDAGVFGNLFILAIVLMVLPPFLSPHAHFLWLRAVAEPFPLFLRPPPPPSACSGSAARKSKGASCSRTPWTSSPRATSPAATSTPRSRASRGTC